MLLGTCQTRYWDQGDASITQRPQWPHERLTPKLQGAIWVDHLFQISLVLNFYNDWNVDVKFWLFLTNIKNQESPLAASEVVVVTSFGAATEDEKLTPWQLSPVSVLVNKIRHSVSAMSMIQNLKHYSDVIMSTMASQITRLPIFHSTERKLQRKFKAPRH